MLTSGSKHAQGYIPACSKSFDVNPREAAPALTAENATPEGCPYTAAVHLATSTLQLDAHQAPAAPHLQAHSERKAKNQLCGMAQHLPSVPQGHLSQLPLPPCDYSRPQTSPFSQRCDWFTTLGSGLFLRQTSKSRGLPKNQNTPDSKDKYHNVSLPPA